MKITKIKVYDLKESIIASGYPMRTSLSLNKKPTEDDLKRAKKLASADGGGHDQFLSGIRVAFDLTCSNKMWVEIERYRFVTFVSSQSTMHRIASFNVKKSCNKYVDNTVIARLNSLQEHYLLNPTAENYLRVLYNIPSGFELTARLTTDYRCLKNIYYQRKDHRLPEWRKFCEWIESLPMAKDLICNKKEKE